MDLNEYLPPRVAVVELSGVIGARLRARDFTALLRRIGRNPRYRAVVLDIDSPGGSAAASEDIYLATRKIAARKPVAAAIRGVGASGSYMVACGTERIFAIPSAVVGSIGVISARPVVEQLLDKLGVDMIIAKSGRYKDMRLPFRGPTPEESAKEQQLLDAVYERFIEIVTLGRPGLDHDRVRALATGEIYLGRQAQEIGLIDAVGDLDDAVAWAAERAGIDPQTATLRPRVSLLQLALSRTANAFADALLVAAAERTYQRALPLPRAQASAAPNER